MSYLILHNGNQQIKPWAVDFYKCKPMNSLADDWPGCDDLVDRIRYAKDNPICTDLTVADRLDLAKFWTINDSLEVIKIITSFDKDMSNLGSVWQNDLQNWINDYNQIKDPSWPECNSYSDWENLPDHIKKECEDVHDFKPISLEQSDNTNNNYTEYYWLQSIIYGLTISNKILFWDKISFANNTDLPEIAFTLGRCGTHVLLELSGVEKAIHHDNEIIKDSARFNRLINSKKILSILRRSFLDQVVSDAISNTYHIMITDSENLEHNQSIINGWKPFEVTEDDILDSFKKVIDYTDLLIGMNLFYNKKVEFSILENLKPHLGRIRIKKNPYQPRALISNYDQVVEECAKTYQPIYDKIIAKLENSFGVNLYND